ncbi:hypothetical protein GGI35DRAFT_463088 [Trichoderma velutinum]
MERQQISTSKLYNMATPWSSIATDDDVDTTSQPDYASEDIPFHYSNIWCHQDAFFTKSGEYCLFPTDIAVNTIGRTAAIYHLGTNQGGLHQPSKLKIDDLEELRKPYEGSLFDEWNPKNITTANITKEKNACDELLLDKQASQHGNSGNIVSTHCQEGIHDYECGINPVDLQIINNDGSVYQSLHTPSILSFPSMPEKTRQEEAVAAHRLICSPSNPGNCNNEFEKVLINGNAVDSSIRRSQDDRIPIYKRRGRLQSLSLKHKKPKASPLCFGGHALSKESLDQAQEADIGFLQYQNLRNSKERASITKKKGARKPR